MCGTVAWLQDKTCGDDEQFDLAAWFPSLKYKIGHVWPAFFMPQEAIVSLHKPCENYFLLKSFFFLKKVVYLHQQQ